jgi:hypothetical protein
MVKTLVGVEDHGRWLVECSTDMVPHSPERRDEFARAIDEDTTVGRLMLAELPDGVPAYKIPESKLTVEVRAGSSGEAREIAKAAIRHAALQVHYRQARSWKRQPRPSGRVRAIARPI